MTTSPHISLNGVAKRFGGVTALESIDVEIERGAVHALVGENGAGKSTLGKIVAGVHRLSEGELRVNGERRDYRSPRDALVDRITIIEQELALMPRRTILQNVLLGLEPTSAGLVDRDAARRRFDELLDATGFCFAPGTIVGGLSLADRQKVEIMRAVARQAEVIVMDEPTAALARNETKALMDLIARLRESGTTIVYVSHFLEEVLSISDQVTTLRDGRLVRTKAAADETTASLVLAMLGRSLDKVFPEVPDVAPDAPVVCTVKNLTRLPDFADVHLELRAGEIVGLAGLVGSGRSEIARAIIGADPATSREVIVDGKRRSVASPRAALDAGIAMVPESRKDQGLVMNRSIGENITIANAKGVTRFGLLAVGQERRRNQRIADEVGIRAPNVDLPVRALSGGNQQKVLFARWLARAPRVLIADEPTRGVDVGARFGIYELLVKLAAGGAAILVISSDLEEVLGLSHRVHVVRKGRLVAEIARRDFDTHSILSTVLGTTPPPLSMTTEGPK